MKTAHRFAQIIAAVVLIFSLAGQEVVQAKIQILGATEEEKAEIQALIDDMKNTSTYAKARFEELEARNETITIQFSDHAGAPGHFDPKKREVLIDKKAIAKMKQIDSPNGGGKALEQCGPGYVLVHEALGHALNYLCHTYEPTYYNDDAAVAATNMVRDQRGSSLRTKYREIENRRTYIPFDDGSKVDATDCYKETANPRTPSTLDLPFKFVVSQEGRLNLKAVASPDGSISLGLAPGVSQPQCMLTMPEELGGGVQYVDILGFSAVLGFGTTSDTDFFNLYGSQFTMDIASFDLCGTPTGTNHITMISPFETPVGSTNYAGVGADWTFNFSGDFELSNDLFTGGRALEEFSGSMMAAAEGWNGSTDYTGLKIVGGVPEPASFATLACAFLGWSLCRMRRTRS